jgi:hypothetical protein
VQTYAVSAQPDRASERQHTNFFEQPLERRAWGPKEPPLTEPRP